MFNIKFKGNYQDDSQLIKRKTIPKDATEFGIVDNLSKEFARGLILILPLIVIMILLAYFKVKDIDYHLTMNLDIVISFFIVIISIYLLTFVHEIIHALFYPKNVEKQIWKDKKDGAYFVYCEEPISKSRFIIMCLAPMFILGIIPFTIWLLLPKFLPMPYYLTLPIIFWFMTIMAMGDAANIYHVVKEVPNKTKVFNYGFLRSFYINSRSMSLKKK